MYKKICLKPNFSYSFHLFPKLEYWEKAINKIGEWAKENGLDKSQVRIEIFKDYDEIYIDIFGVRLETNEEFKKRIQEEKQEEMKESEAELRELERLAAKYKIKLVSS